MTMEREGKKRVERAGSFLLHLFKHISAPFSRHAACFTVDA